MRGYQESPEFGDRTWMDVRESTRAYLRDTFPALRHEDLDDVLSEAVLDGIDYGQSLESSRNDDVDKNFNYACTRARWFAANYAISVFGLNSTEIRSVFLRDDEGDGQDPLDLEDPTADTPLDLVEEADLEARARLMLAELSEAELSDWFNHLMSGKTERELAAEFGIAQQSVHDRRKVRARRLRERAAEYGLV